MAAIISSGRFVALFVDYIVNTRFSVYNLYGQLISKYDFIDLQNSASIYLGYLVSGVYLFELTR